MEINIGEIILEEELNIGEIELDVIKEYPELEDLTVTPSGQQQTFKSNKYGYNTVIVEEVTSQELNIIPSANEQIKEGMFNKVTVAGDSNLISENIKEGAEIFGVEGIAKITSAKITNASYLFYQGARTDYLKETLELCDKVTDMSSMFYYCTNLTNLDLSNFDTSQVTNMINMFFNCRKLINLDLSNFNFIRVVGISNMFYYCSNLTNLKFGYNLGKEFKQISNYYNYELDLTYCKKLTHESLMSVINNLYDLNSTYDVANGGTLYAQSLALGATNLAKLTAEEIAIATSKGWNVT